MWTPQRRISEQLQVRHSSEAAPSQHSDTSNSPGKTEYLLNGNRSSNKPSVTDLLNQKTLKSSGNRMGKSFYSTVFLPRGPCRGGPTGGPQHQPNTVSSSPALLQPLCSPGPCSVSETQGAALGSSLLSLSKSVGAAGFQLSVLTYPCCYSLQCLDPTQPCTEEWILPSSLEEIHPEITPSWRAVLQSSTLEILFSCLS